MNEKLRDKTAGLHPVAALQNALSELSEADRKHGIALAVSGGMDSMVMLSAMKEALNNGSMSMDDCVVLHVNHGLRTDADLDEELVRKEATNLGFQFEAHQAEIESPNSGSLEKKAREARYALLYQAMKCRGIELVFTAQHAGDQAETVLMQQMRGADVLGMGGMPRSRYLVAGQPQRLWRPFLGTPKSSIVKYAKTHSVLWREDQSNKDLRFKRNLVRNLVVPMIVKDDQGEEGLHERLSELGERVSEANQKIVKMAIAVEEKLGVIREIGERKKSVSLPIDSLLTLPAEVSFHLLQRSLEKIGAPGGSLTPKLFAQIITAEDGGEVFELNRNLHAKTKDNDSALTLSFELKLDGDEHEEVSAQALAAGDRMSLGNLGWIEIDEVKRATPKKVDDEIWIHQDELRGSLVVRRPEEGERMAPFGMSGTKLVSDLLQEAGVDAEERWQRCVVADDEGILWLPLIRASERCRVIKEDGPYLRVRVFRV